MIERQHHRVLVDDVERVAQLAGVADAGDLPQIVPVRLQELDQRGGGLVGEAEDDPMLDAVLGGVAGDAAEDREPAGNRGIDRLEVAGLEIGQDAGAGGGERQQVPPHVAVDAPGQIEERLVRADRALRPAKVACSAGALAANRSARSRAISTTRATTASAGSAANIRGRVCWICTRPSPASFSMAW